MLNWIRSSCQTIGQRIEAGLRGLENHDSVISGAISDGATAIALLDDALTDLERQTERLVSEQAAVDCEAHVWKRFAVEHAVSDRASALVALGRARHSDQKCAELDAELERISVHKRELLKRKVALGERTESLRKKRSQLSNAEQTATAYRHIETQSKNLKSIDSALLRWQQQLTKLEERAPSVGAASVDRSEVPLASDLSLERELDELVRDAADTTNDTEKT